MSNTLAFLPGARVVLTGCYGPGEDAVVLGNETSRGTRWVRVRLADGVTTLVQPSRLACLPEGGAP